IPSPPQSLPSTSHRDDTPEADMPLWKRAHVTSLAFGFKVRESSAAAAARQPVLDVSTMDATPRRPMSRERFRVNTLFKDMRYYLYTTVLVESEARYARQAWSQAIDCNRAVHAELLAYKAQTLEAREPTRTNDPEDAENTTKRTMTTTTPMTDAQIKALISQGGDDALAEHEANRSRNRDNNHDSRSDERRRMPVAHECTYINFFKCQPLNFKGTEGVVGLTRCGLPDMIQGSVMASKPKKMQDAIKFAAELMDQKIVLWLNCAPKCTNYKRTGHLVTTVINQGMNDLIMSFRIDGDFGILGHFKSNFLKLKNKNQINQAGNGNAVVRAYAVGTAGTHPNSNVVTGTFFLNNHYASILFDTGADRSFVSTAFSFLIDIIPTTLDHGYDVDLAGSRADPTLLNDFEMGAEGNGDPSGNNQRRNQFFQEASHCPNPPPAYQAPAYQAPGYQALVHQPLIHQPQVLTTAEFTNYMKENDAILKNMQTNMTSLKNSNLELKNMFGQFKKMNTASSLGSRTLPIEHETEVTKDMMPLTNNRSTKDVQPLVVQVETLNYETVVAPIIEPVVAPTGQSLDQLVSPKMSTLKRSFLKIGRALIDIFEGELTLRVGREAKTFNLDQTLRYSANYNDMTVNRIDLIDMDCEEYSQEVLGFSNLIASGNTTPYYDLIVSTSSPTLSLFGDSDFLLGEVDAFLDLEDDATSSKVDQSNYDPEGDILLLEAFLNDDPSLPPPTKGNYLPQDLPPHLKYAFLEGDDKLPVIIAKDLSVEEKAALITVLKLHKRAITWKLSNIKGIDLEFCTHKILIEDDFKPVVQHQRRVNPKIYNAIKKEVLKLLDAGLIYPISDSPWIKKRPHSRILTKDLPTVACLLGYAMHRICRNSFSTCLFHLEKMLKGCEDTNLCLNWENSHFMVKKGIVLGHKIFKNGIEVDKAKSM
nr:reverse transcriptase domain-containing protein [Tanacetum cinerariifolium]